MASWIHSADRTNRTSRRCDVGCEGRRSQTAPAVFGLNSYQKMELLSNEVGKLLIEQPCRSTADLFSLGYITLTS